MQENDYNAGMVLRIYPSTEQKSFIKKNSDLSRFIYNELIALQNKVWKLKYEIERLIELSFNIGQLNRFNDDINLLKLEIEKIRNEQYNTKFITDRLDWYNKKDYDSLTKFRARDRYQVAWNMFHKVHGSGTPNFKRKSYEESYQSCQVGNNIHFAKKRHIRLPKLKEIRFSGIGRRKNIFDKIKDGIIKITTITIKKDNVDNYYLSLALTSKEPIFEKYHKTNSKLGVDLNLDNFLTDSDGNVIENPRYYRKGLKKLRKLQRIVSRRQRRAKKEHRKLASSKNYNKARIELAKQHKKISNRRHEFLNDLSTKIVENQDIIVAEELRSKNMLRNHALAMSISDVGWRTFIGMLAYKARVHDKIFITVDPKLTTQTCSECGAVLSKDNRLTLKDREWTCPDCGYHHIRDHNAAKNILNKGLNKLSLSLN